MRTMTATITPSGTPREHLFFPNGRAFDALDVFLGQLLLKRIIVSCNGAGATVLTPGVLNVYDGRVVADSFRPLIGGTLATNGTLDAWRAIAGGTILTAAYGQPYVANATPHAQVTGLRKQTDAFTFNLSASQPSLELEYNDPQLDGAVVQLTTTVLTAPFSIIMEYEPMVNGATRRRHTYGRGSGTVKLTEPQQVQY